MAPLVIHPKTPDGVGACWAIRKALGEKVEFVATNRCDIRLLTIGDGVPYEDRDIICLVSYPLTVLRAMAAEARSVLVIGQEHVADIPVAPDISEWPPKGALNLHQLADTARSLAGLCWDYFHSKTPKTNMRPSIIDLIEFEALRRTRVGRPATFDAVLRSYDLSDLPAMFRRMDGFDQHAHLRPATDWPAILAEGRAILRAMKQNGWEFR